MTPLALMAVATAPVRENIKNGLVMVSMSRQEKHRSKELSRGHFHLVL